MINEEFILLDSDVIIHFIKGGQFEKLSQILDGKGVLLDKIYNELSNRKNFSLKLDTLLKISDPKITKLNFPEDNSEMKTEYAKLISNGLGKGEAYILAYAKFTKNAIASSNIKDILNYCKANSIKYFTTIDLLILAVKHNILTFKQCNNFIKNVKAQGSILPDIPDFEVYYKNLS